MSTLRRRSWLQDPEKTTAYGSLVHEQSRVGIPHIKVQARERLQHQSPARTRKSPQAWPASFSQEQWCPGHFCLWCAELSSWSMRRRRRSWDGFLGSRGLYDGKEALGMKDQNSEAGAPVSSEMMSQGMQNKQKQHQRWTVLRSGTAVPESLGRKFNSAYGSGPMSPGPESIDWWGKCVSISPSNVL